MRPPATYSRRAAWLALAVLLAVMVAPSAAGARPSAKQLQRRVRALEHSRDRWRSRARAAEHAVDTLQTRVIAFANDNTTLKGRVAGLSGQVAALGNQVTALQGQVTALTSQRDTVLSGLSGAVSVFVANAAAGGGAGAIYNTILAPVRAAWTCGGSTFIGSTFISIDINRIGFCD